MEEGEESSEPGPHGQRAVDEARGAWASAPPFAHRRANSPVRHPRLGPVSTPGVRRLATEVRPRIAADGEEKSRSRQRQRARTPLRRALRSRDPMRQTSASRGGTRSADVLAPHLGWGSGTTVPRGEGESEGEFERESRFGDDPERVRRPAAREVRGSEAGSDRGGLRSRARLRIRGDERSALWTRRGSS